jgi:hypothetical protein
MPFAITLFPKAYKRKKVCWQQTTTLFPTKGKFIANKQPICWNKQSTKRHFNSTKRRFTATKWRFSLTKQCLAFLLS